jgi:HAE1 family hydrophobic/amphiphilic exporter-1
MKLVTLGKWVADVSVDQEKLSVYFRYPKQYLKDKAELEGFPLRKDQKLLPLRAFFNFESAGKSEVLRIENGREVNVVEGKLRKTGKRQMQADIESAKLVVQEWVKKRLPKLGLSAVAVSFDEPDRDLMHSLQQLEAAFLWSVILVFLVLIMMFGKIMEASCAMISVPLGLIGSFSALYLFGCPLSINAVLGMILLNGIAVNNSLILVEFSRQLYASGMKALDASVLAAQHRLRPILITSLTTILAMMPIALGFGEGGTILQPLGVAVAGGMWVSMALTLIFVPVLQSHILAHKSIAWTQRIRSKVPPELA